MTSILISALIEKNALATDTVITAQYTTKDLFGRDYYKKGDFRIEKISKSTESHIFELHSIDDTKISIRAESRSIIAIDGMDLLRYADIYDLLPDGTSKKVGRKRGRKPKSQLTL